ncbi:long-chain fatty acid--CoA ligase [candidate division MSBL1 archaeon SCGC-AAA259J03]|uniref:Long-chain fatty acid--CoA ligase n=1 Tax=candidate division MSBL1 archaeon SCGC-AAA259J03 TaxID=1698269 RepID=A0A656YXE9_9EURY|nr:long-chain fatty acid--CoA ligase [candidate division MSBL1 archaeon SCGC-AAA259J03]
MGVNTLSYYEYQLQLKELLEYGVRRAPEKEIIYRDQVKHTYEDLYERVQRYANALEDIGVERGDTVAVLDWDSHRYLENYFAVPSMGCTLHMVNVRYSEKNLIYTMKHAEDDYVLVFDEFLPMMEEYADELDSVKEYILLSDDEPPETELTSLEYEDLLSSAFPNYAFPDLDEDTRATLFYTTGTTGKPKGVTFTHRKLVLHTLGILTMNTYFKPERRISTDDVYMPLTPMFHVHAWGIPFLATLIGMKQVYPGKYEGEMLMKLIREENVTLTHMVPTILRRIVDGISKQNILKRFLIRLLKPFSDLRVIIGGSRLPKGLAKEASEKLGIDVWGGYGLSETCPVLTISQQKEKMWDWSKDDTIEYDVKTGLPLPFVDLEIVNQEGNKLEHNGEEKGEIVVRSPWLTEEYYKNPEKSEELWRDDWLHTRDVAVIDEEGYVQIIDRLGDLIKSGGEWIGSTDLENIISTHEAVKEVGVIGVPDEKWGERPMAFIVPQEGAEVTEEDIKEYMKEFVEKGEIAKYAIPDEVKFLDELPQTSVGKIDKKVLESEYT